jgi:hypothetical protein
MMSLKFRHVSVLFLLVLYIHHIDGMAGFDSKHKDSGFDLRHLVQNGCGA